VVRNIPAANSVAIPFFIVFSSPSDLVGRG